MNSNFDEVSAQFLGSTAFTSLSRELSMDEKCQADIREHIRYAQSSVVRKDPGILAKYLTWCDAVYELLSLERENLQKILQSIASHFKDNHGVELDLTARHIFGAAPLDAAQLISFHFDLFEGEDYACQTTSREKCQRDAELILQALQSDEVDFQNLVQWQRQMLDIIHIDTRSLWRLLGSFAAYAAQSLPEVVDEIQVAFRALLQESGLAEEDQLSGSLLEHVEQIAKDVYAFHLSIFPPPAEHRNADAQARCQEDITYHISYLAQAATAQSKDLFVDYIQWGVTVLEGLNIPKHSLMCCLVSIRCMLSRHCSLEEQTFATSVIDESVSMLLLDTSTRESFIEDGSAYEEKVSEYMKLLLAGKGKQAIRLVMDMQEKGVPIRDIYLEVFQVSQYEIGRLWQLNKISVADEHFCTATTQMAMSQLYPYLVAPDKKKGCFVAACVGNELHEIGMRMVADFMEMDGWDTYYLGANTPARAIITACEERQARILGLSATITSQISRLRNVISEVRAAEGLRNLIIMVGGYPFLIEPELYKEVGADGYARSAAEVGVHANELVGVRA